MVRLKDVMLNQCSIGIECFNSLMVRLKAVKSQIVWDKVMQFQFPNGSIKSRQASQEAQATPLFQFPNGSIKSRLIPE